MVHQELLSPKSSTRRGWRRHCLVGQNGEDKDLAKRELYHSDPLGVVYWRQGGERYQVLGWQLLHLHQLPPTFPLFWTHILLCPDGMGLDCLQAGR